MAVFTTSFTTPGNYTYDSNEIEVSGGLAKLRENLVDVYARWHMNESAGTNVPDDSGNARDGTATNMEDSDWVAAKLNNGLLFEGTDEHVDFGNIAGFQSTDAFSFICWAKYTSANSMALIGKMQSSGQLRGWLFFVSSGNVHAMLRSSAGSYVLVSTVATFNNDSWHHIAISYSGSGDAAGIIIYINSIPQSVTVASDSLGGGSILNNVSCQMGGRQGDDPLTGTLDEAVLYNVEVAPSIITSSYNAGAGRETCTFYTDGPEIYKTAGDSDGPTKSWNNFQETLGGGNQGTVAYQLSEQGTTWKYWDGGAWSVAGASNYNIASIVDANIGDFPTAQNAIFIKSFLISDGTQSVEIDELQATFTSNQSPLVDAGTNKNTFDNLSIFPFSDCSFSDPDGTVDKAEYKADGEIDIWTEIPQGGFGTLQEAVQAFPYQFLNPGVLNLQLRVTDDQLESSSDNLTVTVSRYAVTFNVKDALGNHLANVRFSPGDGTDWQDENSPFIWDYDYNAVDRHVVLDKVGYTTNSFNIPTTVHTENVTMIILTSLDPAVIADAVWDEDLIDHVSAGSMGQVMRLNEAAVKGRMKLDDSVNQLIIYAPDGITELARHDLTGKTGNPTVNSVFERNLV